MPEKNPLKPPKIKKVKSPILERAKEKGYGPGGPMTPGAKKKKKKKTTKKKK